MSSNGDCFVILPPYTAEGIVIFGRNSQDANALSEAQEVEFYDAPLAMEGKSDSGIEPALEGDKLRIILQKPRPGVWGGDYGANQSNVCVGVAYDSAEESGGLKSTDLVRFVLAVATSASQAVDKAGSLIESHNAENAKYNLIICDAQEAWSLSCAGKLWAAQCLKEGLQHFPHDALSVTTIIDKSCEALADKLKTLGSWNGEGELNFAACFNSSPSSGAAWTGVESQGDRPYTLTSMFNILRTAATSEKSRSATVSVLNKQGISCHWFTATPNAAESVFKPFVFAPKPKISPLTKVTGDNVLTLLHKLHGQRKPEAVDNLKALEAACVVELNKYLDEHPEVDEELDELMKDCVEAEVKFYR